MVYIIEFKLYPIMWFICRGSEMPLQLPEQFFGIVELTGGQLISNFLNQHKKDQLWRWTSLLRSDHEQANLQ